MKHIKFYLKPCKDKTEGILSHYILDGQKVLNRKSYGIRIPYKSWENKMGRVKHNLPECSQVNNMIDEITRNFNFETSLGGILPDEQCVLLLFKSNLERKLSLGLTNGSARKYRSILGNFRKLAIDLYGTEYLPIKYLRDYETIETIKRYIKQSRTNGKEKTNKGLKSYMLALGEVVKHWNATSGTQNPINILPFTANILKDDSKYARVMSENEMMEFENYQVKGKRGGEVELTSKSIYLFQFHCGGIRIHDALLVTNKCFNGRNATIKIRKNGTYVTNPITYGMASSIKELYSDEFEQVLAETRLKILKLPMEMLVSLARTEIKKSIGELNLQDLDKITEAIRTQDKSYYNQVKPILNDVIDRLETKFAEQFFKELSKGDERFIFPFLNFEHFKDTKLERKNFTDEQEYEIHRARVKHNNALKRMCHSLGIEPVSGHTPRHTLSRQLLLSGANDDTIKDVLGHSELQTTAHYLRSRHPLRSREKELRQFYQEHQERMYSEE